MSLLSIPMTRMLILSPILFRSLTLYLIDLGYPRYRLPLSNRRLWISRRPYGKILSVIDRFYPSSKTCSFCGWKKDDLSLSDRVFICENCGVKIDRDLNAAINIKRVGVDILRNRTQRDEVTSPVEASIIE